MTFPRWRRRGPAAGLVLLLGLGLSLGALLVASSLLRVEELKAAPSKRLKIAFAYWDPGPGCIPVMKPWFEIPETREHRERLLMQIALEMRQQVKPEGAAPVPPPPVRFEVCIDAEGKVESSQVLSTVGSERRTLEFRREVSSWRYGSGPARCYKDLAWLGWESVP
jgi:hypothetical protein